MLDDLARSALRAFLECAGGHRGALLFGATHPDRFRASIVAEIDGTAGESITVHHADAGTELDVAAGMPRGLLDQVVRSVARVVVDDVAHPNACFSFFTPSSSSSTIETDPYSSGARARPVSILCAPFVTAPARDVVGVVYLEAAAACAFTASRCKAVEQIVALVVASLENARAGDALALRLDEGARELSRALAERDDATQRLLAQERLASLGMIASGVAHEIKNPLNFVNNFAELSVGLTAELAGELSRYGDRLPPESVTYLAEIIGDLQQNVVKIREHGKRADGIVRDMLQHSRGRAGQTRDIDLNTVVEDHAHAASEAQTAAPPLRATLTLELDPAVGRLRVVPEEMGRVVLNLVNNALDAARARRATQGAGFTPAVTVTTHDLGDRVEVRVRDNGGGIPAAIRDHVYRPFFTTKPTGEGTGLGLSLSRDIVVERHGGELSFSSREGESTEFLVVIPRRPPT